MGQYLSAPATEKESEEGHGDMLAYGLSAMQGWRVSMEDAHITALDLDPATKTSLFAVFDGHGGRAVSQFCAAHLARELLASQAYKRGDLGAAITEAYYRLDVLLDSEEGKAELRQLAADAKPKQPASLFTDVESKLAGAAQAHEERVRSQQAEASEEAEAEKAPLAGAAPSSSAAAPPSSSGGGGGGGGAMGTLDRLNSSKDFLESHLMRASVLSPMELEANDNKAAAGGGRGPAGGGAVLATIASSVPAAPPSPGGGGSAANGGAPGGGEEEEEEEEEAHHAAGMGATAVSVVVRGNQVVIANTGDSRCVLSKRGQARALTLDHKPILFEEAKRIIKAGGFVRDNRINGALNVSRTLGDLDFKRNADLPHTEQMVVATPDIEAFTLEEGDEFLLLACDGIWDVLSNQEAVDFVRKRLKAGEGLRAICEQMCDACLAPDLKGLCRGADNMSVIVVLFKKHARLGGWWSSLLSVCGRKPPYKQ